MNGIARFVACFVLSTLSLPALAQTWPERPVKFILPLGPGAGADIGARLFADRLAKRWGQPRTISAISSLMACAVARAVSTGN